MSLVVQGFPAHCDGWGPLERVYDWSVLDAVSTLVDELHIPPESAALVQSFTITDRLEALQYAALAAFDRDAGWHACASTSLLAWLRDHAGRTFREAARISRTVRRLQHLPEVAQAWRNGTLSSAKVHAIVATLNDRVTPLFAEHETDNIATLASLSIDDTIVWLRQWRHAADDALNDDREPPERPEELYVSSTLDGRRVLNGNLSAETGELLEIAIRLADSGDRNTPVPQRRAEAFGQILQTFVDNEHHRVDTRRRSGRHRPHIEIVLNPHTRTGTYRDGTPVPNTTLERLCCDAIVHDVVMDNGQILHYGRARRTVTTAQYHAAKLRDRGCRFPGCDRPPHWCDAHHCPSWTTGGRTDIDAIALLCRRHHTTLHKPGWHAKLLPDATFEVTDPTGNTRTSRPPGDFQAPLLN